MSNERVGRSKTNLPTVNEIGGGMTNTGFAQIICEPNGERLKPLFKPSKGYCNEAHAVFVARIGLHIVEVRRDREGDKVIVREIVAIGSPKDPDELVTKEVAGWEKGDGNIPSFLEPAAKAAREKANCYHCRESHYSL